MAAKTLVPLTLIMLAAYGCTPPTPVGAVRLDDEHSRHAYDSAFLVGICDPIQPRSSFVVSQCPPGASLELRITRRDGSPVPTRKNTFNNVRPNRIGSARDPWVPPGSCHIKAIDTNTDRATFDAGGAFCSDWVLSYVDGRNVGRSKASSSRTMRPIGSMDFDEGRRYRLELVFEDWPDRDLYDIEVLLVQSLMRDCL